MQETPSSGHLQGRTVRRQGSWSVPAHTLLWLPRSLRPLANWLPRLVSNVRLAPYRPPPLPSWVPLAGGGGGSQAPAGKGASDSCLALENAIKVGYSSCGLMKDESSELNLKVRFGGRCEEKHSGLREQQVKKSCEILVASQNLRTSERAPGQSVRERDVGARTIGWDEGMEIQCG